MEGFAGGGAGGGKGRCFRCGQAGHWEDACPLLAAQVAEQEAELAAWMKEGPDQEEAQRVAGGNGYHTAHTPTPAEQTASVQKLGAGTATSATQTAAAASRQTHQQQQQARPVRQPPLSQAELCKLAGLPPDGPWDPAALTDEQLTSVLTAVWGHRAFRGQQLALIRAALQGRSMLGVLPTGLGKSLTFQMPALLMQGE